MTNTNYHAISNIVLSDQSQLDELVKLVVKESDRYWKQWKIADALRQPEAENLEKRIKALIAIERNIQKFKATFYSSGNESHNQTKIADESKALSAEPPIIAYRWRTAEDNVWHNELPRARVIDAVEINGKQLLRNDGEYSLSFIHRVVEWAQSIFDTIKAKEASLVKQPS
jgi:hypothetical protein